MATLTQSQISQINWYLGNIRKEFNERFEEGERDLDITFDLFNGSILMRVIAFNDWREDIYTASQVYDKQKFGDTIEIFDYNENDCIDMWGENDFEQALEEIQELAECA